MIRRIGSELGLFVVVAAILAAVGCSDTAQAPGAAGRPSSEAPAAPAAPTAAPVVTRATVSEVAGRLDAGRRLAVKDDVGRVVDGYLDGAFVAGDYPREDFSAAFTDFRERAAATAAADLDLLTNHDIGAQTTAVSATRRRVRIDVLAPGGRPRAATARFVLDLDVTGGAAAGAQRVTGSLFLTRQRGAWKVFGYDVSKGAAS